MNKNEKDPIKIHHTTIIVNILCPLSSYLERLHNALDQIISPLQMQHSPNLIPKPSIEHVPDRTSGCSGQQSCFIYWRWTIKPLPGPDTNHPVNIFRGSSLSRNCWDSSSIWAMTACCISFPIRFSLASYKSYPLTGLDKPLGLQQVASNIM